ncbi:MAG: glycoside hydrolase family 88 protein [Bryobacteraceae bacterium]|nr:glycoside hydrolase family 88 protein [Bryobacteraceae bacterium]MDW8379379.1 glycoside hydrolase family 88 protein [Bryobacterales bacterium]
MKRREVVTALGGFCLGGFQHRSSGSVATILARAAAEPPEAVRKGWSCFCLLPGPAGRASLQWKDGSGPARLRITVAFDARENLRLAVVTSKANEPVGWFDIRFAYPFQPFDLPLSARQVDRALAEGLDLILEQGSRPLWLVAEAPSRLASLLPPHFQQEKRVTASDFRQALLSPALAQPFGWMEGCVLDGLQQRWALLRSVQDQRALEWHFQTFFDQQRMPRYVPHAEAPVRHGSEGLLPFAVLARHHPAHPSFDGMLEFCLRSASANGGVIVDGDVTSAEGCYTLAYPLAVLGSVRDDPSLRALAVRQLEHRVKQLAAGDTIYLRARRNGERTFANWARGLAWFALGLVRTLQELREEEIPSELRSALIWCLELAMKWQSRNGLWHCFLDQPETQVETSGSAGIAAALAAGARWLRAPSRAVRAARAAHRELLSRHLLPGGFLGGASQANRDGERLQRSGYRVIAHFGAGLLAQLDAHLQALA